MTVTRPAPAVNLFLLSGATVLATVLYTIDTTVANVALPHIQGSLQATQDQIAWVLTSYIVSSAIATPLSGYLGTRFGLRRVLLVSIAGFTVASMLCGLATSLTEIVVYRLVQGAFGASLVPLCQVALLEYNPRERHGRAMALWGMGVMVGPIIGPTLGGYLTDTLSWRWAFYINVPVGAVAYFGVLAALPRGAHGRPRPFDALGFVLLALAVGLLQLMLDRGQTQDWFQSGEVLSEAIFCVLSFYMFVVHSLTHQHPFFDPSMFRDRNFLVSIIVMIGIGVTVIAPSVLIPVFLQSLQDYSPLGAGELLAVRGCASIVSMLAVGRLVGRIDARYIMVTGLLFTAVSLWMMGGFNLYTPREQVILAGCLQGLGIPLTFVPLSLAAFATLATSLRTEAGVLLTLVRNLGSSIGISVVMTLLYRSTQTNQSYLVEHVTAFTAHHYPVPGGTLADPHGAVLWLAEISRQAAAIAYANDFILLALATAVTLPVILLLRAAPRP